MLHVLTLLPAAYMLPALTGVQPVVSHATTTLIAAVDPFLDPVFNTADSASAVATAAAQSGGGIDQGPLITGALFYVVTMAALTWWDEKMLPKLQDEGKMPTIPGTLRHTRLQTLSKEEREMPWLTPNTLQYAGKGLPELEDIVREPVRIGAFRGVAQYIKAHGEDEMIPAMISRDRRPLDGTPFDADELRCVCKVSPEFTEHYGKRVYLCKRKTDLGDFAA